MPILTPPRLRLPDPSTLQLRESATSGWIQPLLRRPHITDGQVIEGMHYVQHGGQGICITDINGGRHTNEVIRNCIFDFTDCASGTWALRDYETQGLMQRVIVRNVRREHGRYTELAAGLSVMEDVQFENIGAQGYQQRVDDVPQSSYRDWDAPKVLLQRRVNYLECATAKGAGRAAFALSPKSGGPKARFRGREIFIQTVNGQPFDYNGQTYRSFGGMCFEFWDMVHLTDISVELLQPKHTGIQFYDWGTPGTAAQPLAPKHIILDRGRIYGCNVDIRPEWHETVRISGLEGSGNIRSFSWRNGAWRLDDSRPLSAGYSWSHP